MEERSGNELRMRITLVRHESGELRGRNIRSSCGAASIEATN